jgi:hypothetical protein
MSTEPLTIHVDPESDLARALAEEETERIVLESDGIRFHVIRADDDIWAGYDPDAVLIGLQEAAGTLSLEEGEALKALIYRAREEGTRPPDRP